MLFLPAHELQRARAMPRMALFSGKSKLPGVSPLLSDLHIVHWPLDRSPDATSAVSVTSMAFAPPEKRFTRHNPSPDPLPEVVVAIFAIRD